MTSLFEGIINPFLDFLYPANCVECQSAGTLLCEDCKQRLVFIEDPICRICGYPTLASKTCKACESYTISQLDSARSVVLYQDTIITTAIHHFKYNNKQALGRELAHLLAEYYNRHQPQIDVIVPVPLHKTRQKTRGYNQSTILAKHLSNLINKPVDLKTLRRKRATDQQISLSPGERQKNVAGAFTTISTQLAKATILLIDDVFTTGATLNACASALKQGQTSEVHGLTVARALDKQSWG
ncbi:MAG: ComF family protein [Chloroflexota bacterium]